MIKKILKNKKWIFSGIGVFVISATFTVCNHSGNNITQTGSANINANGFFTYIQQSPPHDLKNADKDGNKNTPVLPDDIQQLKFDLSAQLRDIFTNIEKAFKNKDFSFTAGCFEEPFCKEAFRNLWDQPRAPSEIRLELLKNQNFDNKKIEFDAYAEFLGKEYGVWKSYGIRKFEILNGNKNLKIKRCSFLD